MRTRREVEESFEAVPAYIVADKRDQFSRRLGLAGFVIVLLFFTISGYIQSAKNGAALNESDAQRAKLIQTLTTLTEGLNSQGQLIIKLQEIITRQNTALRKAGLPIEPVPNLQDLINNIKHPKTNSSSSSNSKKQKPSTSSSPTPHPTHRPSPKPKPKPSPKPSSTRDPVTQAVCDKTGICP